MPGEAAGSGVRAPAYAWFVTGVLMLVYAMNMADRQIVAILAEDIKADLRLSDTAIGLMTGPAIALFYAVLGLPMARLADRHHRVRLLSACLAVWSAMTLLGGLALNLWQLVLTRLGVSIAEAGATPTSVSLIADYFPAERRGTPLAVFTAGATLGVMIGFALGGIVNELVGWRWAFVAAGAPGIALAALMLVAVREPPRGGDGPAEPADAVPMRQVFVRLWAKPPFRRITYATCLAAFGVYGMLAWVPAYAVRNFGLGTAQIGQVIGISAALGGGPMMILSGLLIDRLAKRGPRLPLAMAAVMMIGSASCFVAALAAPGFWTFVACFTAAYGMLVCYMPVSWTVILADCPAAMRSQATAILLLFIALFSSITAPLAIGMLSDAVTVPGAASGLGTALLLVPFALVLAATQFVSTAASLARQPAG